MGMVFNVSLMDGIARGSLLLPYSMPLVWGLVITSPPSPCVLGVGLAGWSLCG